MLLSSLTKDVLTAVAAFLCPPDVSPLCLSSRGLFFTADEDGICLSHSLLRRSLQVILARVFWEKGLLTFSGPVRDASHRVTSAGGFPHGVILSGSSLVQVCLGVSWASSDLDFYCLSAVEHDAHRWLRGMGFEVDKVYHPVYKSIFTRSSRIDHVVRFYHPLPPYTEVDLVVGTPHLDRPSQVLADFDLRICSSYWDGDRFHIRDPHRSFRGESLVDFPLNFLNYPDDYPVWLSHSPECPSIRYRMRVFFNRVIKYTDRGIVLYFPKGFWSLDIPMIDEEGIISLCHDPSHPHHYKNYVSK